MSSIDHIPEKLFEEDHYLGKPAEIDQKIIQRRLAIAKRMDGFFDADEICIEIGCGNGASTLRMAEHFRKVIALEYFEGHQTVFNELKDKWNVQNADFVAWNIEKAPYPTKTKRLVSFEVIEHLNAEDSVKNYANSLEEGGLALISVPNKWWIFEQHVAQLPLLPWNRVPFFSWLPRPLHERWANARIYTRSRICKLLKKHGFEVLDTHYITAPMDVLPEGWLKRFVTATIFKNDTTKIPFLSTSIMVLSRKK